VDHLLLRDHVWAQTKPWDPEGVLSTVPAIASGMIGVLTGFLMKASDDKTKKTVHLFLIANLLLLLGVTWNQFFPFNKSLWTSSYVLFTSGIALHGLAISYWIIDVSAYKGFTKPFIAFGSNAITAYILSEVVEACLNIIPHPTGVSLKAWLFDHLYASWLNPFEASHLMALTFVMLMYVPIYVLYKKRIIIKI
jgi:predicted acyltransferase